MSSIHPTSISSFYDQLQKIAMTEGFLSELDKLAVSEDTKKKVLKGVDRARPYAYRAVMGAIPGAIVGDKLFPGKHGGRIGLALGAGVGLADRALEDLSEQRKYRKLLTSYQEKKSYVTRAIGEASKKYALSSLRASQRVGM